jgi:hypothetical protein
MVRRGATEETVHVDEQLQLLLVQHRSRPRRMCEAQEARGETEEKLALDCLWQLSGNLLVIAMMC